MVSTIFLNLSHSGAIRFWMNPKEFCSKNNAGSCWSCDVCIFFKFLNLFNVKSIKTGLILSNFEDIFRQRIFEFLKM